MKWWKLLDLTRSVKLWIRSAVHVQKRKPLQMRSEIHFSQT